MRLPRRCAPRNDRRNDMGGKHMRMCSRQHRRKAAGFESRSTLHPACARRDDLLSSFSVLTAGKDLLRRRVNTVAMRKSVTHDSPDRRPAGFTPSGGYTQHWCSGNTPAFQAGTAGSSPVCCSIRPAWGRGITFFQLAAGKDLPAGLTSSGGYTVQRERPQVFLHVVPLWVRQFDSVWHHQRLQKSWHLS